jgi:hypothetical protein
MTLAGVAGVAGALSAGRRRWTRRSATTQARTRFRLDSEHADGSTAHARKGRASIVSVKEFETLASRDGSSRLPTDLRRSWASSN